MMAMQGILGRLAVLGGAAFGAAMACGGGTDAENEGSNGGSGGTGLLVGGTGSQWGQGGVNPACEPPPDDTGCVGETYVGETIPLDIYVMFDLSCSMSCAVTEESGCCIDNTPESDWRLQPVRQAMRSFLEDPASRGIGVGLGFFGDHDLDQNEDPNVCSVAAHADAAVDIARLPGSAEALVAALEAATPQGGTPTHLAIQGACSYATHWKGANPGHKVVILLVTDGMPEHSCNADIDRATAAASDCYDGGSGVEVYVLGVETDEAGSLQQLGDLAASGGTREAYLTDGSDVAGSMLEALNAIRADAAIPCDLSIPDPPTGETLDTTLVNIGICDSEQQVVVTPRVDSALDCGDHDGWYYDDPNSPETIHLCEVTCDTVTVPGSTLFFSVGCQTQVQIE